MAVPDTLAKALEPPNLRRAWRWISASPDQLYRDFSGQSYADFSLCPNELLEDIRDHVQRGFYEPSAARKVYVPKRDLTSRTYTILSVQDQVVYQALANIIADRFDAIARPGYLKQSFGHLYAGKTSRTFYRDWRECRRTYIRVARSAVDAGLEYTATFDLAACYDTISHAVIKHFLADLGLDESFSCLLCECLNAWTANERGIRLGSGIPQGPLPSGLIAEVVLRFFDLHLNVPAEVRYLRYVDDIRLFGRSKQQLDLLMRDLVAISKAIGVYPQASKLSVHLIEDINSELKSISSPSEGWDRGSPPNQEKLIGRILELTRRSRVHDDTRFKYGLSHALPSARLNRRLVRTLDYRPDLVYPIARYFKKYPRLPRRTGEAFVVRIRSLELAPAVRAALLEVSDGRMLDSQDQALNKLAKSLWNSTDLPGDLRVAIGKRLLKHGVVSRTSLPKMLREPSWWIRSEFVRSLSDDSFARRDLAAVLATAVCDRNPEVALAAAGRVFALKLPIAPAIDIHPFAARLLLKTKRSVCGVDYALRKLLGNKIPRLPWQSFLGKAYPWFTEQALECERCACTNASAFVSVLDALIDRLLLALFARDPRLGSYQLGNVGGVLENKRLAQYYPRIFKLTTVIHDKRLRSRHSHAVHRRSGKPTGSIHSRFLPRARRLMTDAIKELASVM
jgi:hypothetical protein